MYRQCGTCMRNSSRGTSLRRVGSQRPPPTSSVVPLTQVFITRPFRSHRSSHLERMIRVDCKRLSSYGKIHAIHQTSSMQDPGDLQIFASSEDLHSLPTVHVAYNPTHSPQAARSRPLSIETLRSASVPFFTYLRHLPIDCRTRASILTPKNPSNSYFCFPTKRLSPRRISMLKH
jgi:hypothetical protein